MSWKSVRDLGVISDMRGEKKVGNASGFLRPGSRFIYSRIEHMGHKLRDLLRSVTHSECVNHEVGACGVCGEQGSRQKLLSSACVSADPEPQSLWLLSWLSKRR